MAGATISMVFDDAQAMAAIDALRALGSNPKPLLRALGVALAQNTRDRIGAGESPDGMRFSSLTELYWIYKRVLRGVAGGTLVWHGMSGGLQGSITFGVGAGLVMVGSNKVYAAIHQFGGVIRPKNAPALRFEGAVFDPIGKRYVIGDISAREVHIPARPYLGFSAADRDSVLDVTEVFLGAALAGRRLG